MKKQRKRSSGIGLRWKIEPNMFIRYIFLMWSDKWYKGSFVKLRASNSL